LAKIPKVRSDTLQASLTGKEKSDKTSYDLVMEHVQRDKSDFFMWHGQGKVNYKRRSQRPRIGYDGRSNSQWYHKNPKWVNAETNPTEPEHLRKQYVPLTLFDLQRAIDLGRLDTSRPIDLNQLQNAHVVRLAMRGPLSRRQYGVILVDQGADLFKTPGLHLEVQLADDSAIAAVEAAGSTVECAFYDMQSKMAMIDPVGYFLKGLPIAKRQLPPMDEDLFQYYNDPAKRGYLCDQASIEAARRESSSAYGINLPDEAMTVPKKHPRQIFFGLEPGMIVNLPDKEVYRAIDKEVVDYNADADYYDAGEGKLEGLYKPRFTEVRRGGD